jgi:hypothetical protein
MLYQSDSDAPGLAPVENDRAFVQKSTTIIAYLFFESKVHIIIEPAGHWAAGSLTKEPIYCMI